VDEMRRKVEYRLHEGDGLEKEEIRLLRGAVYMLNSRGPRTD